MPAAGRTLEDPTPPPTPWPVSWAGCAAPSSPRPAPTTRCCPTRSPRCSATSTSTAATTRACRRCCPSRMAETDRPHSRNWPHRCSWSRPHWRIGGEPAIRLQQLCGAVTAKADGGLPVLPRRHDWCRSTRSAASPTGSGSSAAEFHHSAAATGAAVAARDDGVDHPRHQARRRRPRPHRGAVAGARRCGPRWSPRWEARTPSPDPATGLFLWQNIFGVWPVDGDGQPTSCGSDCTPTPRRRSARPPCTPRGTTRTPSSKRRCTTGWTPSSTGRWPPS